MKRKIALLLAGAMSLSSLPVNVFADTNTRNTASRPVNTRLSVGPQSAANRTAFAEAGVTQNGSASGEVSNNNDVNHWTQGQDLIVEFPDGVNLPRTQEIQFEVGLTNAVWYFEGGNGLPNLLNPNNPGNQGNQAGWNGSSRTFTRQYTDANRPAGRTSGTGSQFLDYTLQVNAADPTRAIVTVNLHPERIASEGTTTDAAAIAAAKTSLETALNVAGVKGAIEGANETLTVAEIDRIVANATTRSDLTALRTAIETAQRGLANTNQTVINRVTNSLTNTAVRNAIQAQGFDLTDFDAATASSRQLEELLSAIQNAETDMARPSHTELENALTATGVTDAINAVAPGTDYVGGLNLATATVTQIDELIGYINNAITAADQGDDTTTPPTTPDPALVGRLEVARTVARSFVDALGNVVSNDSLRADLIIARNAVQALIDAPADTNAPLRGHLATALTRTDALRDLLPADGANDQPANTKRINENDAVRIPLVTRTFGENADASVRVLNGIGVPATGNTMVFATTTESGATTTRVADPQTGRDRIDIRTLGIFENRVGALPANGAFEIVAPTGFAFNINRTEFDLIPQGGVSRSRDTQRPFRREITPSNGNRTVTIRYENLVRSTNMAGSLAIQGLSLVSTNTDTVREGDVTLNIRSVTAPAADGFETVTGTTVANQSFVAGRVADWNVRMTTVGDVPQLINGRLDGVEQTNISDDSHKAATIRVEESINNAWWASRTTTLTLPQEVKVRKVEFKNIRNLNSEDETALLARPFYNTTGRNNSNNSSLVRINDNVISITGLRTTGSNNSTSNNARASFEMDLWLNVESGYTGNIDITLGGSAVNNSNDTESVRVATAINPVQVNAEVTNVRVGYQFVPVGNFTITETVAGALLEGEQVFVTVTDDLSNDMHIANGFDWNVTEGDLRIRNVRTGTNLSINNNNNNSVNVSFEVERESSRPSTIEFSNVQLRMANSAPVSNADAGYDLVVWGPAVAANFDGVRPSNNRDVQAGHDDYINSNDFFRTAGIRTNYINVQSSGSDILTNVVRVTAASNTIMVGDQPMEMDTAAYVSEASNSMMVPVRFVSMALGVDPSRVLWDAETSTVTIDAGERIIQFQTNSNLIRINGIEMPMLNANGETVRSEVRDERAFIPFRALGEALNVHVAWEADTATAIFDPTRQPAVPLTTNNEVETELAS